MIRIFAYAAVLFAAVFAFDRLGALPVSIAVSWPGGGAEPTLRIVVVAVLVFAVAVLALWKVVSGIVRAPGGVRRYFEGRRRDRGYRALSRGLIAIGIGDARLAEREARDAGRLLPGEPLVLLLDAEAARADGRGADARSAYNRMLAEPQTRLLGLRGLFVEASAAGEDAAARHYAAEAHRLSPGLAWAGTAMIEQASAAGAWDEALAVLDAPSPVARRDRAALRRLRAELLTARAIDAEATEPERARGFALEAHRLEPAFVPAAVVAARLLTRLQETRKAAKVIEATWRLNPHPELALAYLHVRTGDSARDRLKRARTLDALRPHHVEGALAVAQAAIDAGEFATARAELAKALRQAPTQRVCLMLADLEERESGDAGRVREWLGRAVKAPRDAVWTADGVVLDGWRPRSPVSGRLGAVEWRPPLATDGAAATLDGDALADLAALPWHPAPPPPAADIAQADVAGLEAGPLAAPVATADAPAAPPASATAPVSGPTPAAGGDPVVLPPPPDIPGPDAEPDAERPAAAAPQPVRPAPAPTRPAPAFRVVSAAAPPPDVPGPAARSAGDVSGEALPPAPPDDPGPANGRGLTRSLTPEKIVR